MLELTKPIIAHRGASAYAPENTMAAFNKAKALGCDWIEFDVMLSEDGQAFVIHDESVSRTTNGHGDVGLLSAHYLESLDAGRWFSNGFTDEKIPYLKDVLAWLIAEKMFANIEIKPYPGQTEQTTTVILSLLNQYWPHDQTWPLISSFDNQALKLYKSVAPEAPVGMLFDDWDNDWEKKAEQMGCYSLHLNKSVLTQKRVQSIKSRGYKVFAYTVNHRRQAIKLLQWGVDAVFSDYPDLLL